MDKIIDNSKKIFEQILKSTFLIGGSSFITMALGFFKTKIIAVLLGPSGIGFMSMLNVLQQLIATVFCLGINSSGIRQLSTYKNNKRKQYQIILLIISLGSFLGLICYLFVLVSAPILSQLSFKDKKYSKDISLLAVSISLIVLSNCLLCVVQGLQKIKIVALVNIISAILGTLFGIIIIQIFKYKGIVLSLIVSSFVISLVSFVYVYKYIKKEALDLDLYYWVKEVKDLVNLGLPIMLSSIVSIGAAYILRIFLIQKTNISIVGQYQAAYIISGIFVNFILNAMGTDYFPRLSSLSENKVAFIATINSQAKVSLLLSLPAIAFTLAFSDLIVSLLYSREFFTSIKIIEWSVYGILGKVATWPLSYILLAKSKGILYFITELFTGLLNLVLIIFLVDKAGIEGAGLAFSLLYSVYFFFISFIVFLKFRIMYSGKVYLIILYSFIVLFLLSYVRWRLGNTINSKYVLGSIVICVFLFNLLKLSSLTNFSLSRIFRKFYFFR